MASAGEHGTGRAVESGFEQRRDVSQLLARLGVTPVATPEPVVPPARVAPAPVVPVRAEAPAPVTPAPVTPAPVTPALSAAAEEKAHLLREELRLATHSIGLAPAAARTARVGAPAEAGAPATPAVAKLVPAATSEARTTFGEQDRRLPKIHDILIAALATGASDVHLTSGARPTIRLQGDLEPMAEFEVLVAAELERMIYAILTQKQREHFEAALELDFAFSVPGHSRFRVNIYRQRESVGAAFRRIPYEIKELEELGMPSVISSFANLQRGFVLVTGPTGSGKSTTLASIIDLANRTRRDHIMTVEDPIEFLHRHKGCLVNQREVGEDTRSFTNALKHALRQDPDIILVGELRDLETISVALTAAETGHLVFGTLHTQDAAQTIDRVIDVFPPHQQQQIRVQLAGALQGIVSQTLCKTMDGKGRVAATEVLVATPAVRNLIREGKTHQISSAMQAGSQFGMHTLDQHLADLVRSRKITFEQAVEKSHDADDLRRLLGR